MPSAPRDHLSRRCPGQDSKLLSCQEYRSLLLKQQLCGRWDVIAWFSVSPSRGYRRASQELGQLRTSAGRRREKAVKSVDMHARSFRGRVLEGRLDFRDHGRRKPAEVLKEALLALKTVSRSMHKAVIKLELGQNVLKRSGNFPLVITCRVALAGIRSFQ